MGIFTVRRDVLYVYAALVIVGIQGVRSIFIESSNLLRAKIGDNVQFQWRFNRDNYNEHVPFRFLFQRYDSPRTKDTLFQYDPASQLVEEMRPGYKNRIQVLNNGGDSVGFNLTAVEKTDVGIYTCSYTTFSAPESSKTLFIWTPLAGKPVVRLVPGESPSLLCTAQATSVPEENRTKLSYRWLTSGGDTLTRISTDTIRVDEALGHVGLGSGPVNVVCRATEEESPLPEVESAAVELTMPVVQPAENSTYVFQSGARSAAYLRWLYTPGSLEDASVYFSVQFKPADGRADMEVYTKHSADQIGTVAEGLKHKYDGLEGNASHIGVTVKYVTLEDAGEYTLVVKNVVSLNLRSHIIIVVQDRPTKPRIISSERELRNSSQMKLECSSLTTTMPASKRTPLRYQWWREDEELKPGAHHYTLEANLLIVHPVDEADYGRAFSCDTREEAAPPELRSARSLPNPEEQIDGSGAPMDAKMYMYIAIGVVVGLVIAVVIVIVAKARRKRQRDGYQSSKREVAVPNSYCNNVGETEAHFIDHNQGQPLMAMCDWRATPAQSEIYLHNFERNPEKLMIGEVIHPDSCYTIRSGTVIGQPEHKVAFKRVTAENWVDCQKFQDIKSILRSQIDAMKECSHDKVIGLLGCVTMSDPLTCIMECAPLGDLHERLRHSRKPSTCGEEYAYSPTSYLELLVYIRDTAAGMQYLHSKPVGILHPFLCSSHILVFPGPMCKVSGFMLAQDVQVRHQLNIASKVTRPQRWLAPETLQKLEHTTKSDVWSFGVLLWETFNFGETPYPDLLDDAIFPFIQSGRRMSKPEKCKDDIFDAMNQCWMMSPESRPDFTQMLRQIQYMLDRENDTYACIPSQRPTTTDNRSPGNEYMVPKNSRPLSKFAEQTSVKETWNDK